mmetsp:Transcript_29885/g.54423  ORF Transcript_29885/g.54423 Transcript_29885/m.54423 type:complete len:321 (+) Transcript_29885:20-982(+)
MGCGASGSTLKDATKENSTARPTPDAGNKAAPASASTCHAEDAPKHEDPKPTPAAAAGIEAQQPCSAEPAALQSLPDQSYVLITGIERRPELNGQAGIVVSFENSDRRYTVRVGDALLSLRESKLTLLSEMEYLQASTAVRSDAGATQAGDHLVDSVISECAGGLPQTSSAAPTTPPPPPAGAYSMEAKLQEYESLPLGTLTARGALVPTYSWVKVPDVATLPPGMEVWMPLVGLKCARIPTTWRLQIVAEGAVDSYRCDVGQHTALTEIRRGAATAFGWEEHGTELRADGGPLAEMADPAATVGSASLFGKKVTALRTR